MPGGDAGAGGLAVWPSFSQEAQLTWEPFLRVTSHPPCQKREPSAWRSRQRQLEWMAFTRQQSLTSSRGVFHHHPEQQFSTLRVLRIPHEDLKKQGSLGPLPPQGNQNFWGWPQRPRLETTVEDKAPPLPLPEPTSHFDVFQQMPRPSCLLDGCIFC